MGAGLDNAALALATLGNGDVVAGGAFLNADGNPSVHLARLSTTCPASVRNLGTPCTGAGGPHELEAVTLPWAGSAFGLRATGLPANSFVLHLTGQIPVRIPVASLDPAGYPGCDLLTVGEVQSSLLFPTAGVVEASIAIPTDPALTGVVARTQTISIEVGGGGGISGISSSNGLDFTLGRF